jgi:UDP-N-acetylmuramate dehydrogenase
MRIREDVPLAEWCTLGIGGAARWFHRAGDESAVQKALGWARDNNIPVHVLGGGSNVVFSDAGVNGLVLQIDIRGIEQSSDRDRRMFVAGAGEPWDEFVALTVKAGCGGVECLSGIPGLVGGTPVQNVGAYGQEVSDAITKVRAIDRRTGAAVVLSAEECGFGYRTSRFKRDDRFIVSHVEFGLRSAVPPTITYADVVSYFEQMNRPAPSLSDAREAILTIRRRKGMVIEPGNPANRSVGSFFVNPVITSGHFAQIRAREGPDAAIPHYPVGATAVKVPAAWLIERVGFAKGYSRGAVGVSPFQAQAIVNHGGATAGEVLALATDIKRAVWETFSIGILPEPVFVGFPPSPELQWLVASSPAGDRRVLENRG